MFAISNYHSSSSKDEDHGDKGASPPAVAAVITTGPPDSPLLSSPKALSDSTATSLLSNRTLLLRHHEKHLDARLVEHYEWLSPGLPPFRNPPHLGVFLSRLHEKNLQAVSVPADGSCLWASVASALRNEAQNHRAALPGYNLDMSFLRDMVRNGAPTYCHSISSCDETYHVLMAEVLAETDPHAYGGVYSVQVLGGLMGFRAVVYDDVLCTEHHVG